jgi:hypothetical protein
MSWEFFSKVCDQISPPGLDPAVTRYGEADGGYEHVVQAGGSAVKTVPHVGTAVTSGEFVHASDTPRAKAHGKRAKELADLEDMAEGGDISAILMLKKERELEERTRAYHAGEGPMPTEADQPQYRKMADEIATPEGNWSLMQEIHLRTAEKLAAAGMSPEAVASVAKLATMPYPGAADPMP